MNQHSEDKPLALSFFRRPVLEVAAGLIGRDLCVRKDDQLLKVRLFEVEAYHEQERACHAYQGKKTQRNSLLFEIGGISYLYFVYGIHWIFNIVTGEKNIAEAVMIRSAFPIQGFKIIEKNRKLNQLKNPPRQRDHWLQGPARLTQGLNLEGRDQGQLLKPSSRIWLEQGNPPTSDCIQQGPRIGIDYAGPDASLPWRFFCSPTVLKPKSSMSMK